MEETKKLEAASPYTLKQWEAALELFKRAPIKGDEADEVVLLKGIAWEQIQKLRPKKDDNGRQ